MINEGPRNCPGCSANNGKAAGTKNGYDFLQCRRCSTLYTTVLPDISNAQDYDGYYSESNLEVPDFISDRIGAIISQFDRYRRSNKLLDIGSGAGSLLNAATELGWQTYGLEVSKPAVEHTRSLGFDTFHGELNDARFPDNEFDVITASEILEHVADPRSLLKEAARILRPGGLVWVTTPSSSGLSYRLLKTKWSMVEPPEHLHLFSHKAIFEMFKNAGFSHIRILCHGFNPYEVKDHLLRSKVSIDDSNGSSRVESSYELNEALLKSPLRRIVRAALNFGLNATALGDSLKVYARL